MTLDEAANDQTNRKPIHLPHAACVVPAYTAALLAHGLVFTSGLCPPVIANGFDGLPARGCGKRQGETLADLDEGRVAQSAWGAHAAIEEALVAAGSDNAQILRQHIWQKNKRFFPVYEDVRIAWQPTPSPSSGLGIGAFPNQSSAWIGIDAIAVAPGSNPVFTQRAIVADLSQGALPSASHYSQAVRSGPLVFTAGHIAIRTGVLGKPVVQGFEDLPEEGRTLATGRSHPDSRDGPIAAQTWYCYNELKGLLERSGLTLRDVVLSTVYLAREEDFAVFHRIHRQFFPETEPALCVSTFNEVGHRGCLVEIELTALDPAGGLTPGCVAWPIPRPFAAPAGRWAGPFLFLSGMPGLDPDGRLVTFEGPREDRVQAQARAALELLRRVLRKADLDLENLAKLTVYLTMVEDLAIFEKERRALLPDNGALPAFEAIVIAGAGPVAGSLIQLDAIAAMP